MAGAPQIPGLPPGVTQQEILQQLMQLSPEQLQQIDPTQRQVGAEDELTWSRADPV